MLHALGLHEAALPALLHTVQRRALPLYLGTLLCVLTGVAWLLLRHTPTQTDAGAPLWLGLFAAGLMVFPASEAVVAVINRLISESLRPQHLARLALNEGIPPEAHRVLVVIPGMLTKESDAACREAACTGCCCTTWPTPSGMPSSRC